ncbi:hypothetical protein IFM89_011062 [Coptis chinensis]|uniref:Uncharacterized protein n=1 Tax=Coptis chinensis TaxID=261450 RepID=A0A835IQ83_9MAGN|nr:hypothetical protein IFM89_011062 [Coptis chinensis]
MFLDGLRELGLKVSQFTPCKVFDDDAPSESSVPRDDPSLPQVVLLDPNVSVTKDRKKDDGQTGKHGKDDSPILLLSTDVWPRHREPAQQAV